MSTAKKIAVCQSMVIKAAKFDAIRRSLYVWLGADTADQLNQSNLFYMWVRILAPRAKPFPSMHPLHLYLGVRNEVRSDAQSLLDILCDSLSGNDFQ